MGDGGDIRGIYPIPTPALPLKGREKCSGALKLALMRAVGNPVDKKIPAQLGQYRGFVRFAECISRWIPAAACPRMLSGARMTMLKG